MPSILYITQVHIESGAIRKLAEECQRHGIHKPLVVTDMGIRQAGLLQRALDVLAGLDVVVYDQTPSNPTEAAVRAATAMCREHRCDGLIALGGGSSMDCAKGVAIAATHDETADSEILLFQHKLISDTVRQIIAKRLRFNAVANDFTFGICQ